MKRDTKQEYIEKMTKLGFEEVEKSIPSETAVADTISEDSKKVPVKTTAIID